MASNNGQQLWSSIAKDKNYTGGSRTFATEMDKQKKPSQTIRSTNDNTTTRPKRAPSPSHIPKTKTQSSTPEQVYVLTLLTNPAHSATLTNLRNRYFPRHLNKLGAHLTLFHALPASKLSSTIKPTLRNLAAREQKFPIHAAKPFRMKRGIAISVPRHQGGAKAGEIHGELLEAFKQDEREGEEWLSEQDGRGGVRVHYTIMNKVEEEEAVQRAMGEVQGSWEGCWGEVVGLGLWRYERGYWKWEEGFYFGGGEGEGKSGD